MSRLPHALVALTSSTALVVAMSPAAFAGSRFHDVGSEVLDDFCGIDGVVHAWDVMVNENVRHPGGTGLAYFVDNVHGTETLTNPETGLAYTHVFNDTIKDEQVVDNGDGTLTLLEHGAGIDRWTYPDGTTKLDTGTVTWRIVVDDGGTPNDPSDDEFLEDLGEVKPSTGTNITSDFCADFLEATS